MSIHIYPHEREIEIMKDEKRRVLAEWYDLRARCIALQLSRAERTADTSAIARDAIRGVLFL